ncbi:ATP-binding cassette domain-containing protein [Alkalilimnicola sp. S0819]|uniref:ATP-binding cassette domain-containing protein n=1 Tax=Alkalilimnicola sp. S0819 TaxID=2613922 RepID=UPI00126238E2|nr:ATP-binding cassette domain-containing protein [Alkalilimnicola sp. S0819]KAB7619678.1 ATP-binding cassette domain-containing protein [Alkalilimnicola sp. S0819]MPQ17534.1 ATP-binding cassette domain-containing protein [Alkalilimnicola sp. S0819]
MSFAIETRNLQKCFAGTPAVAGIDLAVKAGTVYGLLGPNGAGKTTTVRMLATLLKPDGGEARVLGHDVVREAARVRARVSLTGQYASVDEDLTGRENLILVARLLGFGWRAARRRAAELLQAFALEEAAKRQVRHYSGGMRRRLDIAASLVVRSELLFLDEPTTGLDPRSRNQVWELVREIAAQGTTVLLTTQYLEEADRLAQRLGVIDQGRLIAEGSSRELKASVGGHRLHVRLQDPAQQEAARALLADALGEPAQDGEQAGSLLVRVNRDQDLPRALAALQARQLGLAEFSLAQPSLDDVFFALTGHGTQAPGSEAPRP